jgi:hypothetical protein
VTHNGRVYEFLDRQWVRVSVLVGGACLILAVIAVGALWNAEHPAKGGARTVTGAQVVTYGQQGGSAAPDSGDVSSTEALFAATGVSQDQCAPDREYDWNAPGQSFSCIVGSADVRVARYSSASAKADRLADYGNCANIDGGWQLCGPNPDSGRWVRTYVDDDLLFYASSEDKAALLGLDTLDETAARQGH